MIDEFLIANAHGKGSNEAKQFAQWYAEINPDVGIISELSNVADDLRDEGYRVLTGRGSRGRRDNGIVLRGQRKFKDWDIQQLTPNLNRPIAPARFWIKLWIARRMIYALHANAVIQKSSGGWKNWNVANVWKKKGMRKINRSVRRAQKKCLYPQIGGDFNWNHKRETKIKDGIVFRSPEWLAKKRGLDYVTEELMWFMWDKSKWELKQYRVIPGHLVPTGTGDSHPHPALHVKLQNIG